MNYYHDPKYYDLSYSHDMQDELAFLKRIFSETGVVPDYWNLLAVPEDCWCR